MIRWFVSIAFVSVMIGPAISRADGAHIESFHLQDCSVDQTCFDVQAPVVSISHTLTTVSAANVSLTLTVKEKPEHISCASFRYDLKTLFLMCDNSERDGASLSISQNFSITRYPARR